MKIFEFMYIFRNALQFFVTKKKKSVKLLKSQNMVIYLINIRNYFINN